MHYCTTSHCCGYSVMPWPALNIAGCDDYSSSTLLGPHGLRRCRRFVLSMHPPHCYSLGVGLQQQHCVGWSSGELWRQCRNDQCCLNVPCSQPRAPQQCAHLGVDWLRCLDCLKANLFAFLLATLLMLGSLNARGVLCGASLWCHPGAAYAATIRCCCVNGVTA